MEFPQRQRSTTSTSSDASDLSSPGCTSPLAGGRSGSLSFVEEDASEQQTRPRKESNLESFHGTSLRRLKEALQSYSRFRAELKNSYDNTVGKVDELYELLGMDDSLTKWLEECTREEMERVEAFINKDPIILVSGQINCGKSSLVNEMLERTCVPVEKTPCTAMITKLKYSKDDYYQLCHSDGTPKSEKLEFNAKLLKKDIQLQHDKRETSETVECTVEIGLNNPILKYGIQIYDTPGTNENEALDAVVQQSLDGVLQVLLYVIDGNRSLTKQDEVFIETITTKYPDMNILYVCNKCEDIALAKEADAFSDEEPDVDEKTKGEQVYERLQRMKIGDDCRKIDSDSFFPISCKKIRNARHSKNTKKQTDATYMQQFVRLIDALIRRFDECVYASLNTALSTLYALATRMFDYFVSIKFLNQPMWESLLGKLQGVGDKETRAYEGLQTVIKDQCGQMNSQLKQSIRARRDKIVQAVNRRTFGTSIDTLDTAGSASREQRAELADVFQRVIYEEILNDPAFHEIRTFTQDKIINTIQGLVAECERLPGVGDLVPQLRSCFRFELLSNGAAEFCQNMYKKSLSFTLKAILDKILKHLKSGKTTLRQQENIRQAVIRRFLDRIDEKALGSEVARQLFVQLDDSHNRFRCIMETIERAHSSRKSKHSELKTFIPVFSKEICNIQVLISEVDMLRNPPSIPDLSKVLSGHRNEVYIFGVAPRQQVQRRIKPDREGKEKYMADVQELAALLNCGRMLQIKHEHLLTSFALLRDSEDCLRVMLPFCQSNLFYGLFYKMNKPIGIRMEMAKNIVGACVYLAERGFRANDLRPSNILLHKWQPKIDLCKCKSLETPYPEPDNKPAFHFAPEAISSTDNTLKDSTQASTYDTYSCVILIWLLSIGEFVRPPFAQSDSVENVQDVILRDTDRVMRDMIPDIRRHLIRTPEMMTGISTLVRQNIVGESEKRMTIEELYSAVKDVHKCCA